MTDPDRWHEPVRIPADVDREDRVLAGLTARQVAILAVAAVVLWLAFTLTRRLIPLPAFAAAAAPAAVAAVLAALGRRDGVSLDRWLAAGLRHARAPRRLVHAPEGVLPPPAWTSPRVAAQARPLPAPLRLPATAISPDGVISLGRDGAVAVAAGSTVNFALRGPAEQQALTAAFGRWLNSLQHPAQILIRARPAGLAAMSARIRAGTPGLPHPALEQAALSHAAFLDDLAAGRDLLARQILIAVREPAPGPARQRITDATRTLPADIAVTPLDGPQTAAVLAACCTPGNQPHAGGEPGDHA